MMLLCCGTDPYQLILQDKLIFVQYGNLIFIFHYLRKADLVR